MEQCAGGQRREERWGEGQREQLRTFSTDCPLTNIIRLALCIHVQCTFNNSTVDNTSGPALHFTSLPPPPLKGRGAMSLKEDGVEFKQLDDGQSKNAWFVVMAWGCWRAVEPGLHQHRSAAVEEESRAEQS